MAGPCRRLGMELHRSLKGRLYPQLASVGLYAVSHLERKDFPQRREHLTRHADYTHENSPLSHPHPTGLVTGQAAASACPYAAAS